MNSTTKLKKLTVATIAESAELPAVHGDPIPTAPALCPGEHSTPEEWMNFYATELIEGWRKSIDAILTVAKRCAEADHRLDALYRDKLLRQARFNREMFSKLATLGRNEALSAQNIRKYLPAAWTILYTLRYLTKEELARAISEKVLTPSVARKDLAEWVSKNSSRAKEDRDRSAHAEAIREDKYRDGQNDAQIADNVQFMMESWTGSETFKLVRQAPETARALFFKKIRNAANCG